MSAIIDYRGKSPTKTTSGIPLVTAKIVKGGRIGEPDEFISEADYSEWMRRGIPELGDVVMTTEAPLGEVAQLDDRRVALAQRLITLRGKPELLDNGFLRYLLQSEFVQDQLHSRATGTTVFGIRQSELRKVGLLLPPLAEQRAIAAVLGALDDKIELNRRMNATLEGLARALFKAWFVDFEPVRAKMAGRPTGLPAEIDALFPDEMEMGEEGVERPRGWRVGRLGDVAENPRRGVQPENIEPDTPYIALEHMPRKSITLNDWGTADDLASNKYEFLKGEILFGKLRPYFHKVGVAPLDGVCSTDILVIQPREDSWFGFVLGHVSSVELIDHTTALSTGTKMPRTNWQDIASYQVILPPTGIAAAFTELVNDFVARIQVNIEESRTLAALRDGLLPKLMAGEVRVNQVEEAIADVL